MKKGLLACLTMATTATLLLAPTLLTSANAGAMDRYCTPNGDGTGQIARVSLG